MKKLFIDVSFGLSIGWIPIALTFAIALAYAALADPDQTQFNQFFFPLAKLNGIGTASLLALLIGYRIGQRRTAPLRDALVVGLIASAATLAAVVALNGELYWLIYLGLLFKPLFAVLGAIAGKTKNGPATGEVAKPANRM